MTALSVVQKQEHEQGIEGLSAAEKTELSQLETVIEKNLRGFYEVGTALIKIKEGRLYRSSHDNFEEYCQNRWDISRPRAYQFIDAVRVTDNLSTMVDIPQPLNERQARPLARLETPQLQQEAWQKAVETAPDGKVTADHVGWVAHEMYFKMRLAKGQAEIITPPRCEKCHRTNRSKTEPLCSRCRKNEAAKERLAKAQSEWDKIPIDPKSEEFWTKAMEKLNEMFPTTEENPTGIIPTGKIREDLLAEITDFRHMLSHAYHRLTRTSSRIVQGSG